MKDIEIFRKNRPIGGAIREHVGEVLILVPLTAFLGQLAKNAADDAYPILKKGVHLGIKHLVATIREVRGHTQGTKSYYSLEDTVTGSAPGNRG